VKSFCFQAIATATPQKRKLLPLELGKTVESSEGGTRSEIHSATDFQIESAAISKCSFKEKGYPHSDIQFECVSAESDTMDRVSKSTVKVNPHFRLTFTHSKANCSALQLKEVKHERIQNQVDFLSTSPKDVSDSLISKSSATIVRDSHFPTDCSTILVI
jgi:hypothetical protein